MVTSLHEQAEREAKTDGERWTEIDKFQTRKIRQPGRPTERRFKVVVADVRALARTYGEDAIEALVSIMGNAKTPPAARVAAAIAILDRGSGSRRRRWT